MNFIKSKLPNYPKSQIMFQLANMFVIQIQTEDYENSVKTSCTLNFSYLLAQTRPNLKTIFHKNSPS